MTTITQKIWTAGTGTQVITIPKNIKKIYDIKNNDYLELEIKKIIKNKAEK